MTPFFVRFGVEVRRTEKTLLGGLDVSIEMGGITAGRLEMLEVKRLWIQ
jgi:hypothetical protein